jgi:hypothetical protein
MQHSKYVEQSSRKDWGFISGDWRSGDRPLLFSFSGDDRQNFSGISAEFQSKLWHLSIIGVVPNLCRFLTSVPEHR